MSNDQSRNSGLPARDGSTDPWLWPEDITGDSALRWMHEHDARAERELGMDGETTMLVAELKMVLDSPAGIPNVAHRGDRLYNFWTDAGHPRGLQRCTSMDSYRTEEPDWEVLIDIDAFNVAEQKDQVWYGAAALRPEDGQLWRHVLATLSHGNSDVDITREFDLVTKRFVPASEGEFKQSAARGNLSWIDSDTVFIAADSGPKSVSSPGYPLQVRR